MPKSAEAPSSDAPARRRTPEQRAVRWALIGLIAVLILLIILLAGLWTRNPEPVPASESGIQPVLMVDGPGTGDLPKFLRPLSAAFGPTGDLYVSDTGNARICVFTANGRFVREFGRNVTDTPAAQRKQALEQPAGISVDADGSVYVADLRRGEVMVYNRRGRFVRSFRPAESGKARSVWAPTDVALSEDVIAVSDGEGIVLFDHEGEVLDSFKTVGPGRALTRPNGVAYMSDQTLLISDTNNARLVAVGPDKKTVWALGGEPGGGRVIALPRGVAVFEDDSVLVADAFRFNLVHVSEDGVYLDAYGERGSAAGQFEYPNDVDIRKDLVVVADKENHRVQVIRVLGRDTGNP